MIEVCTPFTNLVVISTGRPLQSDRDALISIFEDPDQNFLVLDISFQVLFFQHSIFIFNDFPILKLSNWSNYISTYYLIKGLKGLVGN